MLNNITNFFNLIKGKKIKTQLESQDLIAIGTRQSKGAGDYKPTAIRYADLQTQIELSIVLPDVQENIKTSVVTITETEILNPAGFLKILINSVPGKIIVPLSLIAHRKTGGTAYTVPSTVRLNSVVGSSASSFGSTLGSVFTSASEGTRVDSFSTGTLNTAIIPGNSIQIFSGTIFSLGVITGGTGDCIIHINYKEINPN
ncbi:MAG: hypothetical protein WD512_00705 [Candidatus Paceibacterota bacterium]